MSEETTAVATVAEEVTTAYDSYDEMVSYFQGKIEGISKMTLTLCWEMGQQVNIIKSSAVYGEQTIETFAASLNIPNVKALYRYAQFATEYDKGDLDSVLSKDHIGWGVMNKLISVKDKEDRTDFEDKLDSGEIKPSELEHELSVYMNEQAAEEPEETEEGTVSTGNPRRSYIKHMKKATNTLEILSSTLPLALKDMDDLDEIADDSDKYDKALEYVYSLREMIEAVEAPLAEVQEKAANLA